MSKNDLKKENGAGSILSFPRKVFADSENNRLFIADTNHNRILITDMDGNVTDVIGTGQKGMDNGKFDKATFHHPQGITLFQQFLFIADTDNSLIRRADLNMRAVHTVAGVDNKKSTFITTKKRPPVPLNSPKDVTMFLDKSLFVAMAGAHQIWLLDICGNFISPYAGSQTEGIVDGPRMEAQLIQPCGIQSDGTQLYFADSEASAIRKVGTDLESARVETVVGSGQDGNGDEVGSLDSARFQKPLGLDVSNGKIVVADTYNHKIKSIDLQSKTVATLFEEAGGIPFNEPSGVSVAGDHIYVADTNNHRICRADLSGNKVEPLEIKGL